MDIIYTSSGANLRFSTPPHLPFCPRGTSRRSLVKQSFGCSGHHLGAGALVRLEVWEPSQSGLFPGMSNSYRCFFFQAGLPPSTSEQGSPAASRPRMVPQPPYAKSRRSPFGSPAGMSCGSAAYSRIGSGIVRKLRLAFELGVLRNNMLYFLSGNWKITRPWRVNSADFGDRIYCSHTDRISIYDTDFFLFILRCQGSREQWNPTGAGGFRYAAI